jgi:dTDP-4-dehydrorhamnose reductase
MNTTRRKVVVVGAGGRLGSSLAEFLAPDHEVTRIDRKQMDLGSISSIDEVLGNLGYDHLFLTGALTAVDYCESHAKEAFAVNARGPGRIAEISADKGAHVTYISTDMVFGGSKTTPYVESDTPDPISVYGSSKHEGEAEVMAASASNLVARVSWVYGPNRPAFPEWIIGQACSGPDLTLPEDKICCPTFTLDLIQWLAALVFGHAAGPASGVFHLCNSSPCSWLEWGQFCIDTARGAGFPVVAERIKGVAVDSVPAFVAKRPLNSAMCTAKFTAFSGIEPRHWTAALRDFVIHGDSFAKYRLGASVP